MYNIVLLSSLLETFFSISACFVPPPPSPPSIFSLLPIIVKSPHKNPSTHQNAHFVTFFVAFLCNFYFTVFLAVTFRRNIVVIILTSFNLQIILFYHFSVTLHRS